MPRKPPAPIEVWSWLQLRDWTKTVDNKLMLILAALKDLSGKGNVSPELEREINKAWMMSKRIDLKVPDLKTKRNENTTN